MERVDHVDIIKVCSSSLVCQIDRMLERNVPDRESLEFGIAGSNAAFVFMVYLGKTGCHFSASWSWCGDDYERSGCFDIFIFAISFIAHDQRDIARVSWNTIMEVNFDAEFCKAVLKENSTFLSGVACDAYTSYIETALCKSIDQTKYILIVSDSEVTAHFVLINIRGTDDNDNLSLVAELHEHAELAVRLKSWKNTGCMVIIKKLSAEFQIELVVKFADTVADVFGLHS